jgi:hypothetical protein
MPRNRVLRQPYALYENPVDLTGKRGRVIVEAVSLQNGKPIFPSKVDGRFFDELDRE